MPEKYNQKRLEREELSNLHPDFKIDFGQWFFNRAESMSEATNPPTIKIRVGFDDSKLLDECPFLAKIGINRDDSIQHKFIGFMYGDKDSRNRLVVYAEKFPYSELIDGLTGTGVSLEDSKITIINNK